MNRIALWRHVAASTPDNSPFRQAQTRTARYLSLILFPLILAAFAAPKASAQYLSCEASPHGCIYSEVPGPSPDTLGGGSGSFGGDPVNLATGNVFYHAVDYTTAGPNRLQFIRYYNSVTNSSNIGTVAATLGMNWRSNYDGYLQFGSGVIVAERPDGQQFAFTPSGSAWVTDSDVDYTLTQTGSTYTLTGPDDTVEVYNGVSTGCGQLQTITARNGYQQTLSYGTTTYVATFLGADVSYVASGAALAAPFSFSCTPLYLNAVTDSYGRTLSFTYSSNLLSTVTTPDSLVLTYGYSWVPELTSVSYNTSPATSTTYLYSGSDGPTFLTDIVDENGNYVADWTYNSTTGQAASSFQGGTSLSANYTSFTYGSGSSTTCPTTSSTTTVTNAFGVADTYCFTTVVGVPKVTSISRAATGTTAAATEYFGYDGYGYLNVASDWNGNQFTYTNNSHGQPTSITDAYGSGVARTTSIYYLTSTGSPCSSFVDLPCYIVRPGLTSTFTYDGSGNPLTRTDLDTTTNTVPYSTSGQSRVTTWTWSGTGQELSVKLPRTDVTAKTTFTYASNGSLASITDALSHAWNITASTGGGYPTTITDPNSVTTTLAWDTRLNLNTRSISTVAGSRVTTWTHDPANQLTALQWPDGSKLTYGYDAAHRLTGVSDLAGNTLAYTLDYLGDPTLIQAKNASSTVTFKDAGSYDALGRLTTETNGVSQSTTYTYDPNSNLLTVAPPSPSGTTTFTYDALNRLATRVDPSPGGTNSFTYDAYNRVLTAQDGSGNTTSYVYDGFGERTELANPVCCATTYAYDPDRNLSEMIEPGPRTSTYTYDADDRISTKSYPSDSTLNVQYLYDATAGHGYGVGRLTTVTDQSSGTGGVGFTYDQLGNLTLESRTWPGVGWRATTLAYDPANRVSSITYPTGTIVNYTRDSMGQVA